MEKINNKYLDVTLVIFFSLLIILSRPFVGIYIFRFRLGELLIGASLVMFFFIIYKKNTLPDEFKFVANNLILILFSFLISLFLDDAFSFSDYIFKSSSYIWSIGFILIGYFYKFNLKNLTYYLSVSLIILYIFNTIFYPDFIISFFMNYADKFELSKASNLLISLIFVNVINYYINKNDNFVCYYFIISTSLFLPLLLFNSRGSFIALIFFILIYIIYRREVLFVNIKTSLIYLILFGLIFITSTYNIFGELDFSKRSKNEVIEVSSVSDNLSKLVENKNTVDVFLSFFIYEGRIYSRDGTTDWRLDIWQDIVEDLNNKNQIVFGYGYSEILPIMVDPAAPGRLGEDGLNENVHNYLFTILARGGLVQLIIFIYFHLKLFLLFKSKFKNSFVLILILPAMFNAFLDVAMESVQFPILYYVLLGYMLSTKDNSNNNL
tara:strand:+ start:211 stop:1521 length:1311 start_codon:yes stop_codon:yes gene_type:complete